MASRREGFWHLVEVGLAQHQETAINYTLYFHVSHCFSTKVVGTCPPLGIFREYFGNKGTALIVMMTERLPGKEGRRPGLLDVLTSCDIYRKMKNCLCFSTVPQDIHTDANCVYLEHVSGLRIKYSIFIEFSRNITTM